MGIQTAGSWLYSDITCTNYDAVFGNSKRFVIKTWTADADEGQHWTIQGTGVRGVFKDIIRL